jgi:Domain of unknown function (DUF1996)
MWSCGRAIDEPGWTAEIPQCPNATLVARVTFGQCITEADAKNAATAGLADTAAVEDGKCPPSHPIGVPELRIRAEIDGIPTALSAGSLASLHADFLNAWKPKALDHLIDICIRGNRTANQIKLCGLPGTGPRVTGFGASSVH